MSDDGGKAKCSPRVPGPADERFDVLLRWLDFVNARSPTKRQMIRWATEQHPKASEAYCEACLRTLKLGRFLRYVGDVLELATGGEGLRRTRNRAALLAHSVSHVRGFRTMLALAPGRWLTAEEHLTGLQAQGYSWKTTTQVLDRLEWLLACGVADRSNGRWRITEDD